MDVVFYLIYGILVAKQQQACAQIVQQIAAVAALILVRRKQIGQGNAKQG